MPQNSNLVITQAAHIPKIVFKGTTTAAVVMVTHMEAMESGSFRAVTYPPQPEEKASEKITTSSDTRIKATIPSASTVKTTRTHVGSVVWLERVDSIALLLIVMGAPLIGLPASFWPTIVER